MSTLALAYPAGFSGIAMPGVDRQWHFRAAVITSVAIHGIALGWLPGLADPSAAAPTMQVRLPAPRFEPAPVAAWPAPTFSPAARETRRAPRVSAPQGLPVLARPAREGAPEAPPNVPAIRSAEPSAATVDMPRPDPPVGPPRASAPDVGMLMAYGRELASAVATHQRYPRIALLRQWQGTALLQLELAADGRLLGVRVLSSSGHDTLDRQALDMVREAVPLPQLPAALAGRPLTVDVPVVFRITS